MQELTSDPTPKPKVVLWGILMVISVILAAGIYIVARSLDNDASAIILLPPVMLGVTVVKILLVISPFFFIRALAERKGKNWEWIVLVPASYFAWNAGSLATNSFSVFLAFIQLIVAHFIVRKSLQRRLLAKKIAYVLLAIVFVVGFFMGWNSEYNRAMRSVNASAGYEVIVS